MFRKPFLANEPAFIQLIVFAGIFAGCMLMSLFVGYTWVSALYDINFLANPDSINDYSDPNNIAALKMLQLVSSLAMFIVSPLFFSLFISRKPFRFLRLKVSTPPYLLLVTLFIMVLALPVINAMAELNRAMEFPEALAWLEAWMLSAEEKAADLTEVFLAMNSTSDLLFNLFMVGVIPAVGEELVFRGIIQRLLSRMTGNVHWGIWIAAILFSAMHGQFYGFFPRMLLGALFGYLFVWSGSLWLPILAHFINNGLAVVLSYAIQVGMVEDQVENLGAAEGDWIIALASLVLTCLGLWVLYRRRVKGFAALHAGSTAEPEIPTAPPPDPI